jgi:eukaryotic-like serine/threonine-protein kinase
MGVVYEAVDRDRGSRVAVKTLRAVSGEALLRFKAEFRSCQHLQHPNLVSLGDLYEENGTWFFSMELVEGVDFLEHVRGYRSGVKEHAPPLASFWDEATLEAAGAGTFVSSPPPRPGEAEEARLREALVQLVRGIAALHDAARVHRDIKPSNVLVDRGGRVVILDFGLAIDVSRLSQMTNQGVMGTPLYMAPEQAAGLPVGPPADCYALGVLLYEALTGVAPFEGGTLYQMFIAKQQEVPRAPRELVSSVPLDLDRLCLDLLAVAPAARPSATEVLSRLSVGASRPVPRATTYDVRALPFIGRERELDQLRTLIDQVRSHRNVKVAYVQGESGIGKSALVEKFVSRLKADVPSVVVLSGRCYEHEDVPYKAVDGVIDDVSRYLSKLPKASAAALLPRNATLLRRAFPVLGRVEAFAESPRARETLEPLELRSRVFSAVRELFGRLSDRATLVVLIDDLQWADADSIALLNELVNGPEAPALLLLATVRTDPATSTVELPVGVEIHLEPLGDAEARALAADLFRRAGRDDAAQLDSVVREASGHPLFLEELARRMPNATDTGGSALDAVLWARVGELEQEARALLEIVAVATAPLPQLIATQAASLTGDEAARSVKRLKVARLVTTSAGTLSTDLIEPYHDRVRQAVLAHVDPALRADHHRRIALLFETSGRGDHEALALHWREAGDLDKAAHHAELAGDRATEAFAFQRASRHYRMALELVREPHAHELRLKLAEALVRSGASAAGARLYSVAANGAPATESITLRRKAAEHLLRSGHIDEGLSELQRVLSVVGMSMPASPEGALASFLWGRMRMKIRGLGFRAKPESEIPLDRLMRLDVCWAAAIGLALVDTIRALDFQVRHLRLALEAGEPKRVTRALAMEALSGASLGGAVREQGKQVIVEAEALARSIDDTYSKIFVKAVSGAMAYMEGSWRIAFERSAAAGEEFRSHCTGVAWEIASGRQICLWSLCYLGRLTELAEAVRVGLRECLDAGDLYASVAVRAGFPNCVWLVKDDPEGARRDADAAMEKWSRTGIHLQHLIDLFGQVQIDLYSGDYAGAFARFLRSVPAMQRSVLPKVQLNRILIGDLQGRTALAAAVEDPLRTSLAKARRAARDIASETVPWAEGLWHLIDAQVAHLEQRREETLAALSRAASAFERADMELHLAVCRYSEGELTASETARAQAEEYFRREKVVRVDRFVAVFAPAFRRGG